MKKYALEITLMVLTAVLAAVSFILLPEEVVTQFSATGELNKKPKLIALLIPGALGIFGAVASMESKSHSMESKSHTMKSETKGASGKKFLIVSFAGVALLVITLCVNLAVL